MDVWSVGLQVIAVGLTMVGSWNMGNKHPRGPAICVFAASAFVVLNIYTGLYIVSALSAASALMHLRNFIKWKTGKEPWAALWTTR